MSFHLFLQPLFLENIAKNALLGGSNKLFDLVISVVWPCHLGCLTLSSQLFDLVISVRWLWTAAFPVFPFSRLHLRTNALLSEKISPYTTFLRYVQWLFLPLSDGQLRLAGRCKACYSDKIPCLIDDIIRFLLPIESFAITRCNVGRYHSGKVKNK